MALSDLLVNDEKFQTELSNLVDRGHIAGDEIVDRIKTAAVETIDRLMTQESNEINGVLNSVQAMESKLVADLKDVTGPILEELAKWRELLGRLNLSPKS